MRHGIILAILGMAALVIGEAAGQTQEARQKQKQTRAEPRQETIAHPYDKELSQKRMRAYRPVGMTERDLQIRAALREPIPSFDDPEATFEDYLYHVKESTITEDMPQGIPIHVNPQGLKVAGQTMRTPIPRVPEEIPAGIALKKVLDELGLDYIVHDGLLTIDAKKSIEDFYQETLFLILKELTEVKRELGELREEVQALRDPE